MAKLSEVKVHVRSVIGFVKEAVPGRVDVAISSTPHVPIRAFRFIVCESCFMLFDIYGIYVAGVSVLLADDPIPARAFSEGRAPTYAPPLTKVGDIFVVMVRNITAAPADFRAWMVVAGEVPNEGPWKIRVPSSGLPDLRSLG